MNDPFDPALFNFTRIKSEEILFKLKIDDKQVEQDIGDFLAINVSPINVGHSLILPFLNNMNPQVLNQYSIELGLQVLLMSSSPYVFVCLLSVSLSKLQLYP